MKKLVLPIGTLAAVAVIFAACTHDKKSADQKDYYISQDQYDSFALDVEQIRNEPSTASESSKRSYMRLVALKTARRNPIFVMNHSTQSLAVVKTQLQRSDQPFRGNPEDRLQSEVANAKLITRKVRVLVRSGEGSYKDTCDDKSIQFQPNERGEIRVGSGEYDRYVKLEKNHPIALELADINVTNSDCGGSDMDVLENLKHPRILQETQSEDSVQYGRARRDHRPRR